VSQGQCYIIIILLMEDNIMIKLDQKSLFDKVFGCWTGKSIGGTFGAPYESKREFPELTGFDSPPGQPLPNDDLDLQLVWLKALEDYGPPGVNERVLGEYWVSYIPPQWAEYGIAKSNMKAGLLPPLSGDYENNWKDSNGAWIRSEIWACCAPGFPEIAAKYAWYDACVDHGTGEGVYAELFTASLESAAFVESNRERLIKIGLSYIPADCRVARSVGVVMDCYKKGLGWREARQMVLEDSADLGWFQAPANVAFVVIGWLYGEGDFKKSLLIAVNCGDDTDCTAATLGSILGIIQGADALPEDWKKHVGDSIVTISIDRGSCRNIPDTLTELTNRILCMVPKMLEAHHVSVGVYDVDPGVSESTSDVLHASSKHGEFLSNLRSALRFDFIHTRVEIQYATGVNIQAGQEATLHIKLYNLLPDPRHVEITYYLPDGFELLQGRKHVSLRHKAGPEENKCTDNEYTFSVILRAGALIHASNRGVIQMVSTGRPTVMLIPILFLGI